MLILLQSGIARLKVNDDLLTEKVTNQKKLLTDKVEIKESVTNSFSMLLSKLRNGG